MPGVQVDGVWRAIGAPVSGGHDAELLAQVAANPADGLATLVDAVPGLLAADWAAAVVVPADWAARTARAAARRPGCSRRRAARGVRELARPAPLQLPEVTPLRARAMTGPDGTRYAVAPFGRAGLVLRGGPRRGERRGPAARPAFHVTEVDRVAQLVRAAAAVLGDRLDAVVEAMPAVQRCRGTGGTGHRAGRRAGTGGA